ncbi:MAG: hypothetical protein ONA90_02160 [candidate division KSB1 bacterium]|nr:hypothetical protein [candidate division KSB1 bacterium]
MHVSVEKRGNVTLRGRKGKYSKLYKKIFDSLPKLSKEEVLVIDLSREAKNGKELYAYTNAVRIKLRKHKESAKFAVSQDTANSRLLIFHR